MPAFCDSLKQFDTTAVFGKTLLKAVFRYVKKLMMDQFHQERDRMPVDRRVCILFFFTKNFHCIFFSYTGVGAHSFSTILKSFGRRNLRTKLPNLGSRFQTRSFSPPSFSSRSWFFKKQYIRSSFNLSPNLMCLFFRNRNFVETPR